jgi:hypothetical protein
MIVVYGYNAARHALGVALHSGSGGLCRDPFFDIPKPLFVLEELTCLTTCGDLCRSQKPNTVDSSVSLSVAIGGIIMHACVPPVVSCGSCLGASSYNCARVCAGSSIGSVALRFVMKTCSGCGSLSVIVNCTSNRDCNPTWRWLQRRKRLILRPFSKTERNSGLSSDECGSTLALQFQRRKILLSQLQRRQRLILRPLPKTERNSGLSSDECGSTLARRVRSREVSWDPWVSPRNVQWISVHRASHYKIKNRHEQLQYSMWKREMKTSSQCHMSGCNTH